MFKDFSLRGSEDGEDNYNRRESWKEQKREERRGERRQPKKEDNKRKIAFEEIEDMFNATTIF